MTLTQHGHHIEGTTKDDEPLVRDVHRCGGPKICSECGVEALRFKLSGDALPVQDITTVHEFRAELVRLVADVRASRLLYTEGRLTYSEIEDRLRLILGKLPAEKNEDNKEEEDTKDA